MTHIRFSKVPPSPARTIRKRSYKKFVEQDFLCDFSKIDWSPVFRCQDVDQAQCTFTRLFLSVLDVHAPTRVKKTSTRGKHPPWYNDNVAEARRDKRRQERKWRKVYQHDPSSDPTALNNAKNAVVVAVTKAKQKWFKDLFEDSSSMD